MTQDSVAFEEDWWKRQERARMGPAVVPVALVVPVFGAAVRWVDQPWVAADRAARQDYLRPTQQPTRRSVAPPKMR